MSDLYVSCTQSILVRSRLQLAAIEVPLTCMHKLSQKPLPSLTIVESFREGPGTVRANLRHIVACRQS